MLLKPGAASIKWLAKRASEYLASGTKDGREFMLTDLGDPQMVAYFITCIRSQFSLRWHTCNWISGYLTSGAKFK